MVFGLASSSIPLGATCTLHVQRFRALHRCITGMENCVCQAVKRNSSLTAQGPLPGTHSSSLSRVIVRKIVCWLERWCFDFQLRWRMVQRCVKSFSLQQHAALYFIKYGVMFAHYHLLVK
ncbi:OnnI [Anopheles sinensis]|uniref:OnnI n=1 Tax=Anopheles sinensis TaxID=74873 RepID=A0A084WJE1_ANOSI|nr:OnnI [Anopheles sinensis]